MKKWRPLWSDRFKCDLNFYFVSIWWATAHRIDNCHPNAQMHSSIADNNNFFFSLDAKHSDFKKEIDIETKWMEKEGTERNRKGGRRGGSATIKRIKNKNFQRDWWEHWKCVNCTEMFCVTRNNFGISFFIWYYLFCNRIVLKIKHFLLLFFKQLVWNIFFVHINQECIQEQ